MTQFCDEHRILFIDQQASFDLAVDCLGNGDTWELLLDALRRVADYTGMQLADQLPGHNHIQRGGLSLRF